MPCSLLNNVMYLISSNPPLQLGELGAATVFSLGMRMLIAERLNDWPGDGAGIWIQSSVPQSLCLLTPAPTTAPATQQGFHAVWWKEQVGEWMNVLPASPALPRLSLYKNLPTPLHPVPSALPCRATLQPSPSNCVQGLHPELCCKDLSLVPSALPWGTRTSGWF